MDKENRRSYSKQIYRQLRSRILNGELQTGDPLPSTRELSMELHVARNTVLTAYDLLVSEGFAKSIPGSGFYVRQGTVLEPERVSNHRVATLSEKTLPENCINFDSGLPALDLFPRMKWNRIHTQALYEAPISALGYNAPEGRPEFRRVLSSYLWKTRGIDCHPDQILITTGTKQGLTLVAKCLLDSNSEVWLEDPSNANVKQIFSYHTDHITPIPVDEKGIRPDRLPRAGKPSLLFVTPSHQFPMGGILPIQRRLDLISFARGSGCYLIEDDYDSEFGYDGIPTNSLQELDNSHVIYVGTFSKVMFPSLRVGYLVLPPELIGPCRKWKHLADHHTNSIYQLALMRFIEKGILGRHISKMKKIYRNRRDCLIGLIGQYFHDQVKVYGTAAGMHMVAEFDGVRFSDNLVGRIRQNGVYIVPVEHHSIVKGKHTNQVILGYASLSPDEMEQGIWKLKDVIRSG